MKDRFIGNNVIYIDDIFIYFKKISAISGISNTSEYLTDNGILEFYIIVDGKKLSFNEFKTENLSEFYY